MDLPPFLLNDWLESRKNLKFNMAGSTGPSWTFEELLLAGGGDPGLANLAINYGPPAGSAELREEIAAHHGVDADWVIVANGASEAFSLLLAALAGPKADILLPSPAYPAFAGIAEAARMKHRYYRLQRDRGFCIDTSEVADLADDRTVLVVANSPHNPTGAQLGRGDCKLLAEALAAKGVPLLVDEVFHPVYFQGDSPSAADIANVIVIGDMSKAFSLPGLRIGWIIDACPERRARMVRARSYVSLCGSPITEALALHALRNRPVILDRVNAVSSANLSELRQFMSRVGDMLEWVEPTAGMLAFPWFADGRDSRPFCERLADREVFVVPGDCFGMREHIRIGFGSQPQGLAEALAIFEQELRT